MLSPKISNKKRMSTLTSSYSPGAGGPNQHKAEKINKRNKG